MGMVVLNTIIASSYDVCIKSKTIETFPKPVDLPFPVKFFDLATLKDEFAQEY